MRWQDHPEWNQELNPTIAEGRKWERQCANAEEEKMEERYSVDDRGNVVDFYEMMPDGSIEPVARLDREAGEKANELAWDNWSGGEQLEAWAKENGYRDQIEEAIKEARS